jgi:hypothetical protein
MSTAQPDRYPRKWADMSVDFKLMFGFHICMLFMFAAGSSLTLPVEAVIAGGLFAAIVATSLVHRHRAHWRWQGAGVKQVLTAIVSVALLAVLVTAALPEFPATSATMLPWYFAIAGISLFALLESLNVVRASKMRFQADCDGVAPLPIPPTTPEFEPKWKKLLRYAHAVIFGLAWFDFMAFFYLFGVDMRDGSSTRTPTQTEQLFNHGQIAYLTVPQKALIDVLQTTSMVGIFVAVLGGLFLERVLKIKLLGRDSLNPRS